MSLQGTDVPFPSERGGNLVGWKRLAVGTLLVGYAVTFVAGVPATRRSFIDDWFDHRIGAAIQEGHARIPSAERNELRYYAKGIVSVERVVPIFPGVLMVEYQEKSPHGGVGGRAITLWLPGTTRIIVDAG